MISLPDPTHAARERACQQYKADSDGSISRDVETLMRLGERYAYEWLHENGITRAQIEAESITKSPVLARRDKFAQVFYMTYAALERHALMIGVLATDESMNGSELL